MILQSRIKYPGLNEWVETQCKNGKMGDLGEVIAL